MRELYALEMLGLALFSVHMSVVAIEQGFCSFILSLANVAHINLCFA